jgi:quercetin dioxygenase-like cupin family protein
VALNNNGSRGEELMIAKVLACAVVMMSWIGTAASQPPAMTSQTQNIKRTPLQKFDVPGTAYETVIGIAEIAPNATIGRHTHPGPESGYMLDGEMVLLIEGQPDKTLRAGDSYQVPAGVVHDGRSGAKGAKVIATYVVEKGKPLASAAK